MAESGRQAVSKEPTVQDKRLLEALRDYYQTLTSTVDVESLLPILEKSGCISKERREILKKKARSNATATFYSLLTRNKSQALRRGFLLALKESAASIPNHGTLLTTLTSAAEVDMKSLEEERVVGAVAAGMSACVCVRACVRVCVCVCVCVHACVYLHVYVP